MWRVCAAPQVLPTKTLRGRTYRVAPGTTLLIGDYVICMTT